ncbi:MAG: nitrile hydratase subunit beta, partial [Actinobacteria bacterium]|nr:nitrile hydratase subunit beta [Actinomycetota bacterium]
VFGTMVATMGQGLYNLDEFRHGIEIMEPAHYLASSYYEHWLETLEKNLIEKGVIDRDELDARTQEFLRDPESSVPQREDPELADSLLQLVRGGASTRREVSAEPQFGVGDRVRTRNVHPRGHTRLPQYVRDRQGIVERAYGAFVLPDANAHGEGENPQYVYCVRFDGEEVWGDSAESREVVYVDLWESYLEPL